MLTLRPSRSKDGKEGKTVLKHVFAVNTVPRRLRLVAAGCLLGAFLTSLACLVAKRSGLWKARAIGRSHRDHPRTTASASAGSPAAREPSAGAPLQGGSPWSSSQFEAWFNQMGQDTADPTPLLVHRDRWLSPDDEFSSLLRHIWHAQHPRDCSSARLLILTTHWKQGPGSALHMRGLDLLLGLDYGRVVVDAPDSGCVQATNDSGSSVIAAVPAPKVARILASVSSATSSTMFFFLCFGFFCSSSW